MTSIKKIKQDIQSNPQTILTGLSFVPKNEAKLAGYIEAICRGTWNPQPMFGIILGTPLLSG